MADQDKLNKVADFFTRMQTAGMKPAQGDAQSNNGGVCETCGAISRPIDPNAPVPPAKK